MLRVALSDWLRHSQMMTLALCVSCPIRVISADSPFLPLRADRSSHHPTPLNALGNRFSGKSSCPSEMGPLRTIIKQSSDPRSLVLEVPAKSRQRGLPQKRALVPTYPVCAVEFNSQAVYKSVLNCLAGRVTRP